MVAATTLIGSGNPAFERLFAQEYGRIVSVAFRITRNAADAEDVAQDVFARFARTGRDCTHGSGWLYRAAVHMALNAVRARNRRHAREARDARLQRSFEESAQRACDPQRIVELSDVQAALRRALVRLRRSDAQMLALRYGGLSYAEIANVTGADARQIGTKLLRAERALRREIERETLG